MLTDSGGVKNCLICFDCQVNYRPGFADIAPAGHNLKDDLAQEWDPEQYVTERKSQLNEVI